MNNSSLIREKVVVESDLTKVQQISFVVVKRTNRDYAPGLRTFGGVSPTKYMRG